ncbi:MAG: 16S rRNA (uracil(1498)-N(3))-methyltransferase [Rhodobacteraceae bacterium]|nr:16S rRNA (uracil(1498)-N(3))-methyltransferase [Paracoccaceae bacterium]
MASAKIRLYLDHPLGQGQTVPLEDQQAHYLLSVMRLGRGDQVLLFNGRDGEWVAEITEARKKAGTLSCLALSRDQDAPPDLWLIFAPVKKARTDFIVEKAVELGAARILPVQTDFTNSERVRQDRLQAHAIEAAEQCGACHVPPVDALRPLDKVLAGWDQTRRILWADESLSSVRQTVLDLQPGPWAILVGPEGGFSEPERQRLRALPFVSPISLGPRILRADTAALSAMTLWQAQIGDWR